MSLAILPLLILSLLCVALSLCASFADLDALATVSAAFALLFVVMTL